MSHRISLCLWVAFVLFSLAAGFTMPFSCKPPCKGTYTTKPGLNRHQNSCIVFRTSQALKIEQRRLGVAQSKTHVQGAAKVNTLYFRKGRIAAGSRAEPVSLLFYCSKIIRINTNSSQRTLPKDIGSQSGSGLNTIPQTSIPTPPSDIIPALVTYSQTGRPKRNAKIPRRFTDVLPTAPTPIAVIADSPQRIRRVILHVRDFFRSTPNAFGILREYLH